VPANTGTSCARLQPFRFLYGCSGCFRLARCEVDGDIADRSQPIVRRAAVCGPRAAGALFGQHVASEIRASNVAISASLSALDKEVESNV
jgi:hypothetical protein